MQSPLPVRDGVNATRLRLPDEGPWETALDYMMHRWGHIDPQGIEDRFDAGEIVGEAGVALDRTTPLQDHTFIWYYRTLPPETRIPVELNILHQDDHLLVVDKPHFLPTTPGGTYIQESALVRLRNQLGLPGPHPHASPGPHDGRHPAALHEPRDPGQVPGALRKAPGPEGIRVRVRRRAGPGPSRGGLPRGGAEPDDQVPQLPARRGD